MHSLIGSALLPQASPKSSAVLEEDRVPPRAGLLSDDPDLPAAAPFAAVFDAEKRAALPLIKAPETPLPEDVTEPDIPSTSATPKEAGASETSSKPEERATTNTRLHTTTISPSTERPADPSTLAEAGAVPTSKTDAPLPASARIERPAEGIAAEPKPVQPLKPVGLPAADPAALPAARVPDIPSPTPKSPPAAPNQTGAVQTPGPTHLAEPGIARPIPAHSAETAAAASATNPINPTAAQPLPDRMRAGTLPTPATLPPSQSINAVPPAAARNAETAPSLPVAQTPALPKRGETLNALTISRIATVHAGDHQAPRLRTLRLREDAPIPPLAQAVGSRPQPVASAPPLLAAQPSALQVPDTRTLSSPNADAETTGILRIDSHVTGSIQSTPFTAPHRMELPKHVSRQIAEALQHMPVKPVEISLSPEELGRVRLAVSHSEAGILVSVLAERPETIDLMRRHINSLEAAFQEIGYSDIAFSFAGGEPSGDDGNDRNATGNTTVLIDDMPSGDTTQINLDTKAPAGVDIRV